MSALRVIVPIILGIVAALLNFLVLRGSIAPLELTAVRTEIKADTKLTEDMLERLAVRADKQLFKSAVPYEERGLLLGRSVTRTIGAGEVLLFTDVQKADEDNIRRYLAPGETTLTIPVLSSRIAPGLQRGDSVGVLVAMPQTMTAMKMPMRVPADVPRILGPFRLLSQGTPADPSQGAALATINRVLVAVKPDAKGQFDPMVGALQEVLAGRDSGGNNNGRGVLAIEYYQVAK